MDYFDRIKMQFEKLLKEQGINDEYILYCFPVSDNKEDFGVCLDQKTGGDPKAKEVVDLVLALLECVMKKYCEVENHIKGLITNYEAMTVCGSNTKVRMPYSWSKPLNDRNKLLTSVKPTKEQQAAVFPEEAEKIRDNKKKFSAKEINTKLHGASDKPKKDKTGLAKCWEDQKDDWAKKNRLQYPQEENSKVHCVVAQKILEELFTDYQNKFRETTVDQFLAMLTFENEENCAKKSKKKYFDDNPAARFLKEYFIGVDCSGFVMRVLCDLFTDMKLNPDDIKKTMGTMTLNNVKYYKTNATTIRNKGVDNIVVLYTTNGVVYKTKKMSASKMFKNTKKLNCDDWFSYVNTAYDKGLLDFVYTAGNKYEDNQADSQSLLPGDIILFETTLTPREVAKRLDELDEEFDPNGVKALRNFLEGTPGFAYLSKERNFHIAIITKVEGTSFWAAESSETFNGIDGARTHKYESIRDFVTKRSGSYKCFTFGRPRALTKYYGTLEKKC